MKSRRSDADASRPIRLMLIVVGIVAAMLAMAFVCGIAALLGKYPAMT